MKKTAVVTGAGSGVGRAAAIHLLKEGWRVALLGRRLESLNETASLSGSATQCFVVTCDVSCESAVAEVGRQILEEYGSVEVLVNAAGTNVPRRSLEVLASSDYHEMINTNLNGSYYCVQAFLKQMRVRRSGTIVNIVSDSARQASPKAGPGYSMSKFGVLGLTQAINAEERPNGIRACAILPGDIDTDLLALRPTPPDAVARARMMQADDIARCVMLAINLPPRAVIEEILIRPGA